MLHRPHTSTKTKEPSHDHQNRPYRRSAGGQPRAARRVHLWRRRDHRDRRSGGDDLRRRGGHPHLVAQLQHRPRVGLLPGRGRRLHEREPQRQDRDRGDGPRGHGHPARGGLPVRQRARHLHGAWRRRAPRPRRGRPDHGHLRVRCGDHRQDRRLRRRLAGRRQDLRSAVLPRRRRLLVQHPDLGRQRPRGTDHVDRVLRGDRHAQGCRRRAAVRGCRVVLAAGPLLLLLRPARVLRGDRHRRPGRVRLLGPVLDQGG